MHSHRPMVRWWWLRGPFTDAEIRRQLELLAGHGFGGVELAWLDPSWLPGTAPEQRPAWRSEEFQRLVAVAAREAARLGMQCDLTLGSAWPFGGSVVGEHDAARTLDGLSVHRLEGSWEAPARPYVLDHLSAESVRRYTAAMASTFQPALAHRVHGIRPALFCDSFELDVDRMWTPALDEVFAERFGYDLATADLDDPRVRYDHLSTVAEAFLDGFVRPFTDAAHEVDADARVQCHGAPVDLLAAYASVDVPESETLLFDPQHSRIAASAAALAGRPVVSCEAFTCLYGFVGRPSLEPLRHWHAERVDDLRLVADAVFANGVNRIVWHGAPYQPEGSAVEFYASVHVAPDGALWGGDLRRLNGYLAYASMMLQGGRPAHQVAVLLGVEDGFAAGRIPPEAATPGAAWHHEQRHARPPADLAGYHPLWVSGPFLEAAAVTAAGRLDLGGLCVDALVVDVGLLEQSTLRRIVELAEAGAAVQLRRCPQPPGTRPAEGYDDLLDRLAARSIDAIPGDPLVSGPDIPPFWARLQDDGSVVVFLAHPACADVRYPLRYGQAEEAVACERDLVLRAPGGRAARTRIRFAAGRSVAVRVYLDGSVEPLLIR